MAPLAALRDVDAAARIPLTVLGGAIPTQVREAETRLGIGFPREYQRFLMAFGAAEVGGRAIFGLGADLDTVSGLNVVWHTEEARRRRGLAGGFIVVSAWDDLTLEIAQVRDDEGRPMDGSRDRTSRRRSRGATCCELRAVARNGRSARSARTTR